MKLQTNVKIEASQKDLFLRAARMAKEDLTEFLVNSAMLRIQHQLLAEKPVPAMDVVGQVYLQPYAPDQVTDKEAKRVEQLAGQARKGKLSFKKLGKIGVAGPGKRKG
jgi:hypothetical protein